MKRGAKVLLAIAAAALIVAASAPLAVRQLHDSAWRVPAEDRVLVDRALAGGAAEFGMSPEDYRRVTRPSVSRLPGRTCVGLRTAEPGGAGSYFACYDGNGRLISLRAVACSFGATRISDRLRALIW